jgi:hypothetical protein
MSSPDRLSSGALTGEGYEKSWYNPTELHYHGKTIHWPGPIQILPLRWVDARHSGLSNLGTRIVKLFLGADRLEHLLRSKYLWHVLSATPKRTKRPSCLQTTPPVKIGFSAVCVMQVGDFGLNTLRNLLPTDRCLLPDVESLHFQ